MKLFKDTNNTVFAYELDGSQDHLIGNKTPITQKEADAIYQANQANLPQAKELTPAEKLASIGLTAADLQSLLGAK
jgi:hypothetical protein